MKHYFMIVALIAIILTIGINPIYAQQKSTIKHTQDFNYDTQQVFNQLFEECPGGIVLYKMNGETLIVCLMDNNLYKIVNKIDIDIHEEDNDDNNNSGGPDGSCLFNVNQPKCAPDEDGNCPDGFNMNEDGRCFPDHHEEGCPDGYHGTDDDETGQCYNDNNDCPDGMELVDGNCTYINEEEQPPLPPVVNNTPLEEVEQSDSSDDSTVPEVVEETENTEETTTSEEEEEDTNSLSTESESSEEEENNN